MTLTRKPKIITKKSRPNLWFEKLMAIIAVINLIIVFFDLSYVPLRDFWLNGQVSIGEIKSAYVNFSGIELKVLPDEVSQFVLQYDRVKGIVPNHTTEQYLVEVARLKQELATKPIDDPKIASILSDLRIRSVEMIQNDAFEEAGKSGNLERLKNRMREHLSNEESATQAFWQFWSIANLQNNTIYELAFFDSEIKPLLETNYYRRIAETGTYLDNFGFIDFPFGVIFALEFLARTWFISRTRTAVSWLDAMLWRWYDVFFFLPFWRWLRVIPTAIRLQRSQLLPLDLGKRVQKQISQGIVAGIAEDVTEVVTIRIINQLQLSIRQGDIGRLLAARASDRYIDINNTNETAEIIRIFANTMVDKVLPKIEPEAEALLHYTVEKAIKQSPAYRGFGVIPGGKTAVSNLTKQLVSQTYKGFAATLKAVLEEDKKFEQLLESLFKNLNQSFITEIKAQQSLNRIETLLIDLLEEIKINYVERLSLEDVEQVLEQTRSIRQVKNR